MLAQFVYYPAANELVISVIPKSYEREHFYQQVTSHSDQKASNLTCNRFEMFKQATGTIALNESCQRRHTSLL